MTSLFLFISGEYFVRCLSVSLSVSKMMFNCYINCIVPLSVQNKAIIPS